MKTREYVRLTAQVAILREITTEYSGKTIDNIIQQMQSRLDEIKQRNSL